MADVISDLLCRLGTRSVQRDERTELEVCAALAGLGVMRLTTAGRFAFVPRHEMDAAVVTLLTALDGEIPLRYFIERAA